MATSQIKAGLAKNRHFFFKKIIFIFKIFETEMQDLFIFTFRRLDFASISVIL